ncbi:MULTISPECIES: excalibur calcium-binding domain-containing protein [unclassified Saccharopolyspora]|uniref:excalibur calcium-binding domain-containing protein n=1 Tax=unclassified Saccharopolyspora TaxID=2646250 RepID=UPI001CD30572|nr:MULTISPECIES: excalibur calcium-binding domain-containing protein [unclassified Saccharopolyspora]MCA1188100.1 excalibur calcium-binding domain-containing protein [Saccharopolyspora sp. 6T]MCA1229194.1 excalibur calcium-binding domain-containing protein [Saccharopolyspora sp. 6M]MCA1279289.1 excalibur calcium-binding domain-containing protein [Saccharopolyspora sp. 7B]
MGMRTFPQLPNASSRPRPHQRKWPWITGGVFLLLFVVGLAASCASPPQAERAPVSPVATTPVPVEPAEAEVAEPEVALPVVEGRGARAVLDELRALGLTAVTAVSDDASSAMPVPETWVVSGIEPAAGTAVRLSAPVVVRLVAPAPPSPARLPRTVDSAPEAPVDPAPEPEPYVAKTYDAPEPSVYYQNCDAARAAGAAPVYRGDPGYRPKLDRDGDGIGCEN